MEDRRKYNGGNSTAATRPDDKRLNPMRRALQEAFTPEDVINVLKTLQVKAMDLDSKDGVQAAKLFLEYALGKPKENIEISGQDVSHDLKNLITFVKSKEDGQTR